MSQQDIPALKAMEAASGFPYPDVNDPLIEAVMVAEDESGKVVAAVAAKRIVELYLWIGPLSPVDVLAAVQAFHAAMGDALKEKGYHEANAFLPPQIADKFGRRLTRTFGWVKNWSSWARRF